MVTRIITAALGIPVFLYALWVGGLPWALFIGLLTALGSWEIARLLQRPEAKRTPEPLLIIVGGLLFVRLAYVSTETTAAEWVLPLICGIALAAFVREIFAPQRKPLRGVGGTLLGVIYVGGFFSHLVLLREGPDGFLTTLMVTLGIWISDSAAYFGGRAYGRRKLLPAVSPNKTWEGSLTGLAATGVFGALFAYFVSDLAWPAGAAMGLFISTAGQLGDLAASALKRESGIKDTGGLLPGHGGIIDRFDSLLFAAVVVYYGQTLLLKEWLMG